ncbi:MAG: hypothetical protein Q7K48_02420 [Fusobacterium sp. JB021]|nr:hypothetical protein [Fusobacterium sp. JB020]MDP0493158.1 hypothetical protein [Fusobacterium sp. JB021]
MKLVLNRLFTLKDNKTNIFKNIKDKVNPLRLGLNLKCIISYHVAKIIKK